MSEAIVIALITGLVTVLVALITALTAVLNNRRKEDEKKSAGEQPQPSPLAIGLPVQLDADELYHRATMRALQAANTELIRAGRDPIWPDDKEHTSP